MGEVLVTGGELVARVLKDAGVGHVFTLCGGHILPIYDGLGDEEREGRGWLDAEDLSDAAPISHFRFAAEIAPALERALGSHQVWCINVALDPAAYRRTGQVSMAI